MFTTKSFPGIKFDAIGEYVELPIDGYSELRGQVDLDDGALTSLVIGFLFSCAKNGGRFHEPTTSTRFTAAEGVSAAIIDCRGFARCRMKVITAAVTAGTKGTLTIAAYKPD